MEKNTVLLDLSTYQKLKDFEREVLSGKVACVREIDCGHAQTRYYTEIEVIENLTKEINYLKEKLKKSDELSKEIKMAALRINISVENSENTIKQMSIWEFLKWRKSK